MIVIDPSNSILQALIDKYHHGHATSAERERLGKVLDLDKIYHLHQKYGLSYHTPNLLVCHESLNLSDKKVLEVGGCMPPELTIEVLGCREWFALESEGYDAELEKGNQIHRFSEDSKFPESFTHAIMNIEDLGDEHNNTYDVVFSIAAFEHIVRFPAALAKMYQVLKPGGMLFAMFAPIWSSFNGHHLPPITTKSGDVSESVASHIPVWGHLLFNRIEMREYLLKQSIDGETVDEIVYYIYDSPHINRYFTEDYLYFIEKSPFIPVDICLTYPVTDPVPENLLRKIQDKNPGRKAFMNNGIGLLLKKENDFSNPATPDSVKYF